MARILFVVHRYYPFPGGSENYVRWMAEEMKDRGHEVAVYAPTNRGDQNGVKVTSDRAILNEPHDLIVVHGADVEPQNFVITNKWPSPVLYMIILPSGSTASKIGMQNCKYISWSTSEDWNYIRDAGYQDKAINIRHGIKIENIPQVSRENVCKKYGIDARKKIFLSCGGYWPNKKMKELAELFEKAQVPNSVLITTGYGGYYDLMPHKSNNVFPLIIEDFSEVQSLMTIADLYIMYSDREGFGLVLLEASMRGLPWAARHQAGAAKLVYANGIETPLGYTFFHERSLVDYMWDFVNVAQTGKDAYVEGREDHFVTPEGLHAQTKAAREYVEKNHLIGDTCDDIEAALKRGHHDHGPI